MNRAEKKAKLVEIHQEFTENKFQVPESWGPWIGLIKFFLKAAKEFVDDEWDAKIDRILKAIEEWIAEKKAKEIK